MKYYTFGKSKERQTRLTRVVSFGRQPSVIILLQMKFMTMAKYYVAGLLSDPNAFTVLERWPLQMMGQLFGFTTKVVK